MGPLIPLFWTSGDISVVISAIPNSFEILNMFVTFKCFSSIKKFTHKYQSLSDVY